MNMESPNKYTKALKEIARGLMDSATLGFRLRREDNLPADFEKDVDQNLVDIFNSLFPDKNFSLDNITDIIKNSGITNSEYRKLLDCYLNCPEDKKPEDLIPKEISDKFK